MASARPGGRAVVPTIEGNPLRRKRFENPPAPSGRPAYMGPGVDRARVDRDLSTATSTAPPPHASLVDVLGTGGRFARDLWESARRPPVFRRCLQIAVTVGTLLSLVNQGDLLVRGEVDLVAALRIAANYMIPFVVSNLGAMTSLPPRPR